jgi:ATP-binding cassette, subfamily B, bacterial
MCYVAARIDWQLVLIAAAISPVLALASYSFRNWVREPWHRSKEVESRAMSVVQKALGAVLCVFPFAVPHITLASAPRLVGLGSHQDDLQAPL